VAHPARVYDYWLGGKDNFPADRTLAELMIEAIPNMRAMAAANRAFLSRAVRYLAEAAGITLVPRGRAEVEEFFTGLDPVDPGLTPVLSLRPEEPPADPRVAYSWARIARKP
jgi:hypothetical protein